jgi:hypothetical protein
VGMTSATRPVDGDPNAATNAFDNIPGVDEDPKQKSLSAEDVLVIRTVRKITANAHEGQSEASLCTTTYNTAIQDTKPPPLWPCASCSSSSSCRLPLHYHLRPS